jgi:hypothetical protein
VKAFLVGDNPFHNISHLSQDRTRSRGGKQTDPDYAAGLIVTAVENGANGFLFSVSDTTLAILRELKKRDSIDGMALYPIVPYAYEYVRLATQVGGMPGLAKVFAKRLVSSGSFRVMASGLNGVLRANPSSLLKVYLAYELNRVEAAAGKKAEVKSIILHEVVVDVAIALKMEWFFREYWSFTVKRSLFPGFNTCNFALLVRQLNDWHISLDDVVIAAPFNKIGFQMNPTKQACEEALCSLPAPGLVAISVLAAGYLKLPEAVGYIAGLSNVKGVAVGISKEEHARQTFKFIKDQLS